MGCTCSYSNIEQGLNPFDEEHYTIDSNMNSIHTQKDMTRVTSMSRISSQRSVLLTNYNQKRLSIKIDLIGFGDQILEEYNLARTNPKFYAYKIKTFIEKIEKDSKSSEEHYYFINTSGTKIVLKNALRLCNDLITHFESQDVLLPLLKNELLVATAKKGMENIKQTKIEREQQLKEIYQSFSSDESKSFGSIFGFGDFDPGIVVILQLIDGKDNSYPRACILNPNFLYCGINVVESEKLKVLSLSHFMN